MNPQVSTALLTALALAASSGLGLPSLGLEPHRDATIPTEKELEWIKSLNAYRQREWTRRFQWGLTAEQRRYVDEQVSNV